MNQDSTGTHEPRNLILIGQIVSVGILLLAVAVFAPPLITEEYRFSGFDLVMELVRDVGIAFVTAAVVGGAFELGARRRFLEDMTSNTLHEFLGDWIGPDIWRDVRKQILDKKALRKNLDIKFRLFEDPEWNLPDSTMVLWFRVEYDLYLKEEGKKDRIEVAHYLLSHVSYGDLPRFTKVEVGDQPVPIDNIEDGVFKLNVDVEGRDGNPVRVVVEREELVHLPGMFTLFTYEMSKGVSLLPMFLPKDVEASVNVLPPISSALQGDTSLKVNKNFCPAELKDLLFLPGQAIEIWFEKRG